MARIKKMWLRAFCISIVLCMFLIAFTSCNSSEKINDQETIPIIETANFELNDLVITAKQVFKDDSNGLAVDIFIENNSIYKYSISTSAIIINNGMTNATYSCEIGENKSMFDLLYIPFDALESAGIINVGVVEIYFDVQNRTTNELITNAGVLTVKLSEPSLPMVSGHILYDQYGVKIYGQYVDESTVWGSSVLLYVQNTSDQNILISCEQVSVNDCEVMGTYHEVIYANKHSVDNIPLESSNMNVNEIDRSDSIILKLKIVDADTMKIIDVTDPISFRAN